MSTHLHHGSILDVEADCIVNPANSHLAHGGGLAAVIARAATDFGRHVPITQPHGMHTASQGDFIRAFAAAWQDEQREHPLIATGDAGWTSAGALSDRYKGIVHAVGPVWGGGSYCEPTLLYMAHVSALLVAGDHGCKTVAFPAVSCGIFGYPVEQAAPTAIYAALAAESCGIEQVTFALMEDEHFAAYSEALA